MRSQQLKGIALTVIISLIFLTLFFGKILFNLNQVFFGAGGDGLLTYANTVYHIKYDSTYMHERNMNYPFGENVFFTSCLLPLSGTLKFLKGLGIDLSDYTIGIMNSMMLFSFPLCAVILFLIFIRLRLPWGVSALISVLIAFLSPQMMRLGGHYNLAYAFVIPLVLYLLLLYYEKGKLEYSIYIALFTFIISVFHIYYIGIIGAIILGYWCFLVFVEKGYRSFKKAGLNIVIQLFLPFILLKLAGDVSDHFTNRTTNPWGYFYYRSYWEGVFIPLKTPLEKFFHNFFYIDNYEYEGLSYIGFVSTIFFMIVIGIVFWRLVKWQSIKSILSITNHSVLNAFFWSGVICYMFSIGLPFVLKLAGLVNYLGFIKQIRSVGRFAWVFYYTMNIVSFYLLYFYLKQRAIKIQFAIWAVAIALISVNVYFYLRGYENALNNQIAEWFDKENKLPNDQWLNKIDVHKYQAFLPLPYTHLGSESIWYGSDCSMGDKIFIIPVKTGLPTLATYSSRTSITQTYESLALIMEPYRPLKILNTFPSKKPLLVISRDEQIKKTGEKELLNKCRFLLKEEGVSYYELEYDSLQNISEDIAEKALDETKGYFNSTTDFFTTDTTSDFWMEHFDHLKNKELAYRGEGCLLVTPRDTNVAFEKEIQVNNPRDFSFSYWLADVNRDVFPRTLYRLELWLNNKLVLFQEELVSSRFKTIDGPWVLVETNFPLNKGKYRLKYSLINIIKYENYIIGSDKIRVDEILLKPSECNVYKVSETEVYKNNRFYMRNSK